MSLIPSSAVKTKLNAFIFANGELSQLFLEKDWSKTPLGAIETWPQALRTSVGIMLQSKFPTSIQWGSEKVFLYNDAYCEILGSKHPRVLGSVRINDRNIEITSDLVDQKIMVQRNGQLEECYFTFSESLIRDENDQVEGIFTSAVEVTERKQNEIARLEGRRNKEQVEEKFKTLAESIPQLVWVTDGEGKPEYFNQRYIDYSGIDIQHGIDWLDAVHPEDVEAVKQAWEIALAENETYEVEYRLKRKSDGRFRWFKASGDRVMVDGGLVPKWFGTSTDIHDQKLTALALEEINNLAVINAQKFDALFTGAPAALAFKRGPLHIYEKVNDHYLRIFNNRDILGKSLLEALPEVKGQIFPRLMDEVYRTGIPYVGRGQKLKLKNNLNSDDTDEIYLDFSYQRINDGNGAPVGIFTYASVVTDRVLAERALKESQSQLELALEAAQMGPWMVDVIHNRLTVSARAAQIFEVSGEPEPTVKTIDQHIHPDDRKSVRKLWTSAVRDHQPYSQEYRVLDPHGAIKWVMTRGRADYAADGTPLTFAGIVMDITDRKNFEVALKNAKDAAERANQLKSAFLANMSHEIRTPLGAMIGFADLLRDPDLSKEERESFIDVLTRNGQQLSVIINDILDLSKVEAGHLNFEWKKAQPIQIAEDVLSLLQVTAAEKNISLRCIVEPGLPNEIITDAHRLKQILFNILGNAIKFTREGGITLRVFNFENDQVKRALGFEISDTGIGIAESSHEKLFQVFSQADDSITRKYGGTGLGLALSRKLAKRMGGDVILQSSSVGHGSTFLVTIQNQIVELDQEEKALQQAEKELVSKDLSAVNLADKKVLLVEDSPDNQHLIRRILRKKGMKVETADNGVEGVSLALKGQFDIVLMDIQMPVMDGYTATQTLRERGYDKPIIALTAHAMSEVRKRCLTVGCTDHLPKPINSRDLVETIARHTQTDLI